MQDLDDGSKHFTVGHPIDEDGPNDHGVSGGNQQPDMALWLVFIRILDS